jgi:hypothetical protein
LLGGAASVVAVEMGCAMVESAELFDLFDMGIHLLEAE